MPKNAIHTCNDLNTTTRMLLISELNILVLLLTKTIKQNCFVKLK